MNRLLQIAFVSLSLVATTFCQEREVTSRDLNGVPKSHKYAWAVLGGTAVGIGIGVIAPGGNKSAVKGALIGGSLTSFFYLHKNPRAAYGNRGLAHLITNTALGTGVLWTICNCGTGAWAGAFLGAGGTALAEAFGSRRSPIASLTSTNAGDSVSAQNATVRKQNSTDVETIVMAPEKSLSKANPSTHHTNDNDLVLSDDNNLVGTDDNNLLVSDYNNLVGTDRGTVAHDKKQLESRQ